MSQSILKVFVREITRAFRAGLFTFTAFGRLFIMENVSGNEYRVTTEHNDDCGIRFFSNNGSLSFRME